MIKISEPPKKKETRKTLHLWVSWAIVYAALFFVLVFRWGPTQLVLSAVTRSCQDISLSEESNSTCIKWVRFASSNW